ncbi:MAG: glycosyltransferase family 4 protein [Patescibacteria group bacterium]
MKILSLSLDSNYAKPDSPVSLRTKEYGALADLYWVIAPGERGANLELGEKVKVIFSGGHTKPVRLARIYHIASRVIKENKFDVITVQDAYFLAMLGWVIAKRFDLGLELQIHGFEKFFGLRKIIAKFVLPKADSIRTVSQRMKNFLINNFNIKEKAVTAVPVYYDVKRPAVPEFRHSASGQPDGEKEIFVFLTVARLAAVKRIDSQVMALAQIVKKFPQARLWIVGSGPEEKRLKELARKTQLENYVQFFGWQENPDEFYSRAGAYLLTSDSEGWGMSVIEAAAYGLPIIMTDAGCAGEIIINGESGIVVPAGNTRELIRSMELLISDPELRKKLGQGAKAALKKLKTKEETLKLYKKSWERAIIK